MSKLKVDDRIISRQEEKQEAVWDFYSNLLGKVSDQECNLNLQNFYQGGYTGQIFSEEEVWRSIKSLPPGKAPGPDGYTGHFYKSVLACH